MLSSFDDFPVHQTSRPIAQTSSADLNHYDRYFFNGYTRDARLVLRRGDGAVPEPPRRDAAFSVVVDGGRVDGRQINVHASRRAPTDRADANEVGPIKVEVIEPLHALRLQVDAPEHGLRADLTFVRRSAPIEEPHFLHQVGVRVMFDYTRLTQFGGWEGWIEVDGELYDLAPGEMWGSRDRSWGVRPVGERSPSGAPVADPQFFWLWAPVNFETFSTHFDVNELFDGRRWHETAVVAPVDTGDGVLARGDACRRLPHRVDARNPPCGGVRARSRPVGRRSVDDPPGTAVQLPDARHRLRAPGVVARDLEGRARRRRGPLGPPDRRPDRAASTDTSRRSCGRRSSGGLGEHEGIGILEQLAIGRHVPTGLEGIFDGYSAG